MSTRNIFPRFGVLFIAAFICMSLGCGVQAEKTVLLRIGGGSEQDPGLGALVDRFSDINGDDCPEIIAASVSEDFKTSINVYSGRNGALIYRLDNERDQYTTRAFSVLTDFNGDDIPEIAVLGTEVKRGLSVFSGKDGTALYTVNENLFFDHYDASRILVVPDKNDDGVQDFALRQLKRGLIVFSGKDGSKIKEFDRPRKLSEHVRYNRTPDIDGDGFSDIIRIRRVHLQIGPQTLKATERIAFLSSADFGPIGEPFDIEFSREPDVLRCTDVNGDGMPDVIATNPAGGLPDGKGSVLQAISGKDGSEIWRVNGTETEKASRKGDAATETDKENPSFADVNFGETITLLPDINGDGVAEIATGHPELSNKKLGTVGRIYIFSGKDGTVLRTLFTPRGSSPIGTSVAGFTDWNGDGTSDILAGVPAVGNDKEQGGAILILSL